MQQSTREEKRVLLQDRLDAAKSQAERNRLGPFATPAPLARDIVRFGISLLGAERPIRFLDPAFGTGAFFSALLDLAPRDRIESAKGFELDAHYGAPARALWQQTPLDLTLIDFTRLQAPSEEQDRFNLLICNPPYVRHHHMLNGEKTRLQDATEAVFGTRISGLAGLYCYFLALCHAWMQSDAIAGWLIPSEFMDVNYGLAVKKYLMDRVTLLQIHRFDPNDVQFDDALVSSAVVWFRNRPAPANHTVRFTFGGSLSAPALERSVAVKALRNEPKWTRFPGSDVRKQSEGHRLSDLFTIKRGIATGDSNFFILTRDEIEARHLPWKAFRPILPSPRYIQDDEIASDPDGHPLLDRQLFLLDCRLPEARIKERLPNLWEYLATGKGTVSERYLCRTRKVWYFQEHRPPAPILCTYMARASSESERPFRFLLNHSQATAANVYLLLYPKSWLARAISNDPSLLHRIWQALNDLQPSAILGEGRVYGGGLHKLEPKELGNVDATPILNAVPTLHSLKSTRPKQYSFLHTFQ
jgi:adenine-specific DNA-methyltransferase